MKTENTNLPDDLFLYGFPQATVNEPGIIGEVVPELLTDGKPMMADPQAAPPEAFRPEVASNTVKSATIL